MFGLDADTGRRIGGIEHLRHSIRDILTTPIGSRVMRRDYGSKLFDLIDQPFSGAVKLAIVAATAEALIIWEPRIEIEQVTLSTFETGKITINLSGIYLPDGDVILLEGIEVT